MTNILNAMNIQISIEILTYKQILSVKYSFSLHSTVLLDRFTEIKIFLCTTYRFSRSTV